MGGNKWVVAYGFEYDKIIIKDYNCSIGKSFNGKNPVYCSLMIEDKNIYTIIDKIKLLENCRETYLSDIDRLSNEKNVLPKWQLVTYDKDFEYYIHVLQGKMLNYNSELNPCFR
jgi:hypothetical protein